MALSAEDLDYGADGLFSAGLDPVCLGLTDELSLGADQVRMARDEQHDGPEPIMDQVVPPVGEPHLQLGAEDLLHLVSKDPERWDISVHILLMKAHRNGLYHLLRDRGEVTRDLVQGALCPQEVHAAQAVDHGQTLGKPTRLLQASSGMLRTLRPCLSMTS